MAKPRARAFDLPFREQAEFWRRKVNVPTATWRDLQRDDHAHGFMVAGAARQDLLDDLRKAVDKAVLNGGTIAEFRKDFDAIVARTGWQYHGGRNWRTRIIYDTNVRSAYQAGRWTQMQAIKHRRPYWQYIHNDARHPRPEHQAWNGKILHADDPWWSTHYPPNGYGCHCTVHTLAQRDLDAMGKQAPDDAPTAVDDSTGLDPGFDYNVGTAASSMPAATRLGQKVMQLPPAWRQVALADAQTRPADMFAGWAVTVKRVVGELERVETGGAGVRPLGSTHALGFLRPQVVEALEAGGAGGRAFAVQHASTALLAAEDRRLYHAMRSSKADVAILREQFAQLPQWLADPATAVLWDTADGEVEPLPNLIFARRLADGRYAKFVFGLETPAEGNRAMRQARLRANWLRSAGIVSGDNLRTARHVLLAGRLE